MCILNIVPHISCNPSPTPAHLDSAQRQQSNSTFDTRRKREIIPSGWATSCSHSLMRLFTQALSSLIIGKDLTTDTRSHLCPSAGQCTVTNTCTHMLSHNVCFQENKGIQRECEKERGITHYRKAQDLLLDLVSSTYTTYLQCYDCTKCFVLKTLPV